VGGSDGHLELVRLPGRLVEADDHDPLLSELCASVGRSEPPDSYGLHRMGSFVGDLDSGAEETTIYSVTGIVPPSVALGRELGLERHGVKRLADPILASRDPAVKFALLKLRREGIGVLSRADRFGWVAEDEEIETDLRAGRMRTSWAGRFSALWEGDLEYEHGPQGVALEEALAWARERAARVRLRVRQEEYSAGEQPIRGLPAWDGEVGPRPVTDD
jgi:hypothetical protein